jgi:hypothetical protein
MELSIDLTDLNSQEIIEALERYPYGHLEIKSERVFWITRDAPMRKEPPIFPPASAGGFNQPKPRGQMQQANHAFKKMSDTLGSMIC